MSPSRPRPPEFVLDTDVVVAGAGAFARQAVPSEPVEAQLLRRWTQDEWRWVSSADLLAEYEAVLLEHGAPVTRVRRVIARIRARARLVVPRRVTVRLRDPDDAHVIGTVLAGAVPLVTRNIRDYPTDLITVLTPDQMMAQIEAFLRHPMRPRRTASRKGLRNDV